MCINYILQESKALFRRGDGVVDEQAATLEHHGSHAGVDENLQNPLWLVESVDLPFHKLGADRGAYRGGGDRELPPFPVNPSAAAAPASATVRRCTSAIIASGLRSAGSHSHGSLSIITGFDSGQEPIPLAK